MNDLSASASSLAPARRVEPIVLRERSGLHDERPDERERAQVIAQRLGAALRSDPSGGPGQVPASQPPLPDADRSGVCHGEDHAQFWWQ